MIGTKVLMAILLMTLSLQNRASGSVDAKKYYDESRKLSLQSKKMKWLFFGPEDYAAQGNLFVAKPVNNENSALSFRADKGNYTTAKKYAEKWLKDYPKFGFELQLSQENSYGELNGFEIELTNPASDKKIRQFLVKNDQEIWVFTCSASTKAFAGAWKNCKDILSTSKLFK